MATTPKIAANGITTFDPALMGPRDTYNLMVSAIVPRPIAWVSTISEQGIGNLAPFSFYNGVSSEPPTLVFSVTRKGNGEKKDTLKNIEATRQFVVNGAVESLASQLNDTSADLPFGIDELSRVGLTALPSVKVKPHRVKESPLSLECELYDLFPVGGTGLGSSVLVVGKIVLIHAATEILDSSGKIDIQKLAPISRLGGHSYAKVGETFEIMRPKKT